MRRLRVNFCTGYTCSILGGEDIRRMLNEFSDLEIQEWSCLGNCRNGPNAAVDGKLHERLTPEKLRDILKTCGSKAQKQK